MLEIRSTNSACFISTETGDVARVTDSGDGYNFYQFERTDEVMEAFIKYREGIHKGYELRVNLVDYTNWFTYYTKLTMAYKN